MKKMIFGLATCGLILSSCSSNDVFEENQENNNPNVINFSATTTRATVNNLDNVKTGFPVYAVTNDKKGPKPGETPNSWYIAGQTYSFATNTWVWSTPAPQWPTNLSNTNEMHFYAYYPADVEGDTDGFVPNATTAGTLTGTFTINTLVKDQIDFLAANTPDIAYIPQGGSVPLAFKHITTKINFGVNAETGTKVYVQQMNINNVKNQGTYDYVLVTETGDKKFWSNVDFTKKGETVVKPAYDYYQTTDGGSVVKPVVVFPKTDNQTSFYPCTPEGEEQQELSAGDKHLMLLPQAGTEVWTPQKYTGGNNDEQNEIMTIKPAGLTITPLKAYIGSVYRMSEPVMEDGVIKSEKDLVGYATAKSHPNHATSNHKPYPAPDANKVYDGPLFVKVGFPLNTGFSWIMGKAYTYNIKFGYNGTSTDGYILDNRYYDQYGNPTDLIINGKKPGEEVSGGTINFDVTVGNWEDGQGTGNENGSGSVIE